MSSCCWLIIITRGCLSSCGWSCCWSGNYFNGNSPNRGRLVRSKWFKSVNLSAGRRGWRRGRVSKLFFARYVEWIVPHVTCINVVWKNVAINGQYVLARIGYWSRLALCYGVTLFDKVFDFFLFRGAHLVVSSNTMSFEFIKWITGHIPQGFIESMRLGWKWKITIGCGVAIVVCPGRSCCCGRGGSFDFSGFLLE